MKILVINPGSTSTKLAVFEEEEQLCSVSVSHSKDELSQFDTILDQLDFRYGHVKKFLVDSSVSPQNLDCIVSRGGTPPRVRSGATEIGPELIEVLHERPMQPHASNLGPMIAYRIACEHKIFAYIYDPITTNELNPYARAWGVKDIEHDSMGHVLNTRAVGLELGKECGKRFEEMNIITVHIGGGNSVSLWSNGAMTDTVTGDSGSFSAERCGGIRAERLIALYRQYGHEQFMRWLGGKGGMASLIGTNSLLDAENRVISGDAEASFYMEAMGYQIAKSIGSLVPVVKGRLDAIIFTGGGAYWKDLINVICDRIACFGVPVVMKPGEREIDALAQGALRVMRGEEMVHQYSI